MRRQTDTIDSLKMVTVVDFDPYRTEDIVFWLNCKFMGRWCYPVPKVVLHSSVQRLDVQSDLDSMRRSSRD